MASLRTPVLSALPGAGLAARRTTKSRSGSTIRHALHHSNMSTSSLRLVPSGTAALRAAVFPKAQARSHARAASASASAETAELGLVMGKGEEGAWDAANVGSAVVRVYLGDNSQRWMMWYEGRAAGSANPDLESASSPCAGIAISDDGITWFRSPGPCDTTIGDGEDLVTGMVLAPNEDDWWWFDTCHLTVSDVQVLSDPNARMGESAVYWMFYSGGDFEELPLPPSLAPPVGKVEGVAPGTTVPGIRQRLGLALSQDGRNWARIEGDHHSGALFDVGEEGEWDSLYIARPQVIREGPRDFRMFYQALDPNTGKYTVGLAVGDDGTKWRKVGKCFAGGSVGEYDALGAASHWVTRDPEKVGQYLMFYEAVAEDGKRCISVAKGDGKLVWERTGEVVLAPSGVEGAWDESAVGMPCAVPMDQGKWRLYYSGSGPDAVLGRYEGVGLAISTGAAGAAWSSFKRRGE